MDNNVNVLKWPNQNPDLNELKTKVIARKTSRFNDQETLEKLFKILIEIC